MAWNPAALLMGNRVHLNPFATCVVSLTIIEKSGFVTQAKQGKGNKPKAVGCQEEQTPVQRHLVMTGFYS
jgi:hypothetical protein